VFSKLTGLSAVFLFLTAFTVTVAAIFRNPLLVYTAVFLVTSNIVLYIWAQNSVRGLAIKRRHPKLAVAANPLLVTLELTNERNMTRYGILGFDLHDNVTPGNDYTSVAFYAAPRATAVSANYQITPPRRGVFSVGPFYLYGGDPFGFYKCWRRLDERTELIVLPRPVSFRFTRPASVSHLAQDEMETIANPGSSTEFLGVREYRSGDQLRHVHWPSTARLGTLISRQHEQNVAAAISALVLVEDQMQRGTPADNPLEYSLTMVASLAHATLSERFMLHYLALTGDKHDTLSGHGRSYYQELAIRLAHLKGGGTVDWEKQGKVILNYLPRGSSLLVFTANLNDTTLQRLRQMAVHFRSLAVITFNRTSFERASLSAGRTPRLAFGEGFLMYEVSYGDNLARALEQALAKSALLRRSG
jgi:uncharacterized protein (DUF58 family)